jgi:putative FmdB family regulatory protein
MPTYEFRCPKGHEFEKFYRSISGAPSVVACPTCGKTATRQMSAGGGLLFKGSGFYITDYGKDGKKGLTPAPVTGEGAPPATTEAKPAASESGGETKAKPEKESKPAETKPAATPSTKSGQGRSTKRSE